MISFIDDSLAELKPQKEAAKPAPKAAAPPPPPPAEEKWSRENHPAFKKPPPPPPAEEKEPEVPVSYQVNDNVMAKWLSGDKGFYAARITSVTGSSTNPIYTVKFKSYDTVETLRAKDIRPAAQKRKADGSAVTGNSATAATTTGGPAPPSAAVPGAAASSSSSAAGSSGIVLSAEASLYPQAQQAANQDGADAEEKPRKKFKKIKAKKELEAGKTKWQEFNAKGKFGKSQKKDSMFRTPEGVHGRGMLFLPICADDVDELC